MPRYRADDRIRAEFKDDRTGESEGLWIKVDDCDDRDRLVFGWLESDPVVFAGRLKRGDHLGVSFKDVREHKRK